ncbi:MAG: transglycosylase SLT domain-containing protein [Pseudomonadota bacterium]
MCFKSGLGLILACFLILCPAPGTASSLGDEAPVLPFTEAPLPDSVALCGEPAPISAAGWNEAFEVEFSLLLWRHSQVLVLRKRAGRYFPFVEKMLSEMGLPDDLKYLAAALSSLQPEAEFSGGTAGFWRLSASDAREYGLRVEQFFDERRNFEKSTRAALRRLKDLRAAFGTWALALSAYRFSPRVISEEIEEQGTRDYYQLDLTTEGEAFIPRVTVIKLIMENPLKYGYAPEARAFRPIPADGAAVDLVEPIPMADVARRLGTRYKVLKEMNPEILGRNFPAGRYEIKVPVGQGARAAALLKQPPRPAAGN